MTSASQAKAIALGALALLLLIFVMQNTGVVSVHFLFWSLSMSQVILIGITATLGFACGFLAAHLLHRRPARPSAGAGSGFRS